MMRARLFLAACLLACALLAKAEDKSVQSPQSQVDSDFLESWYQVPPDAQPTDRIALYPADVANISSVDPIRYTFVPSTLNAVNTRAAAQLWTSNHGRPLQVVYARGPSHDTAVALTAAPLPASEGANFPVHGRLSIGQNPGEVRVSWATQETGSPEVRFGTAPGAYTLRQFGTYSSYTAADMCSQPANAWGYSSPGVINTAVLQQLAPNTTYYYTFGQEGGGWSEEASFTTPPATGSESPVRFLVTADIGINAPDGAELPADVSITAQLSSVGHLVPPGSQQYTLLKAALLATGQLTPAPGSAASRQLMKTLLNSNTPYHGLLMLGGMSMGVGHGSMWDDFLQQMEPVLTRVPLAAVPGDTEAADPALQGAAFLSLASGGECGVPYTQRLRMPHRGTTEMWYSSEVGPVHLIMLNTEQTLAPDSAQYRFLQADLAAVDRSKTPWVVVGMHRGMYADDPTDVDPSSPSATLQAQIERLLVENSVDLVLNGHARLYHQSCPIVQGRCVGYSQDGTAFGPVHAMLGIGGAAMPLRAHAAAPYWVVDEAFEHGVAEMTADKTHLTLKVVSSRTGQQVSSFTLKKPTSWRPNPSAASQRFAQLAKAQGALASLASADSSSLAGVDFAGLSQLLQEDLVKAAAAAPAVLERFAGPNSYMAKVVASLAAGDAPAPSTTWQTTMQLLQLALTTMSAPAAVNPMQPGPQDPNTPPAQQPIMDPPNTLTPPTATTPAQPDVNPLPIGSGPNPNPPLVPGPVPDPTTVPPPQLPMVPIPTGPLPAQPQLPMMPVPPTGQVPAVAPLPGVVTPVIPPTQLPVTSGAQPNLPAAQMPMPVPIPTAPLPVQQAPVVPVPGTVGTPVQMPTGPVGATPQVPTAQQPVLAPQPEQPIAAQQPVLMQPGPQMPPMMQQPAQQRQQQQQQTGSEQPQQPAVPDPQQQQAPQGPAQNTTSHGPTASLPRKVDRKPQHSWKSPPRPLTQPKTGRKGTQKQQQQTGGRQNRDQAGGQAGHGGYYQSGFDVTGHYGVGGAPQQPQPPPCDSPDCGGDIPPCDGPDCRGDVPPCTDPACGCEGDQCMAGRKAPARNQKPADKVSAPNTRKIAPVSEGTKADPRFHYGEWFGQQQRMQQQTRQGRPLPRPTVPAAPAPTPSVAEQPQGRSAKRISIPKKAWGDPTVAPMDAANVGVASLRLGSMSAFMDSGAYPEAELKTSYQDGGVKVVVHRIHRASKVAKVPMALKVSKVSTASVEADDKSTEDLQGPARSLLEHGVAHGIKKKADHKFSKAAANLGARAAKAAKAALARAGKPHGSHAQDSSSRLSRSAVAKMEGSLTYKAAHKAALMAAHAAGRAAGAADGVSVASAANAAGTASPTAAAAVPTASVSPAPAAAAAPADSAAKVERVLAEDDAAAEVVSFPQKPVLAQISAVPEPGARGMLQEAQPQQQQQQQQQQDNEEEEVEVQEVEEEQEDAQTDAQTDAMSSPQQAKEQPTPMPAAAAAAPATPGSVNAQQGHQVASQQQLHAASTNKALHAAAVELVFGKQVGGKALQLPDQLVLVKADGTAVSQEVIAAFRYIWQLLQGRLMMGDPSTLVYFQPNWAGGWLVEHPSSQPSGRSM